MLSSSRIAQIMKAVAIASVLVVLSTATGPVAEAATGRAHPDGCAPDAGFTFSAPVASHIAALPYNQGGPGHTLSISLTAGMTVQAQVGGSVTGGVSVLVASAQEQVSASLSVALTASVTYGDTWPVPLTAHQGYLDVGAASDSMSWTRGSYNGACVWIMNSRGTLNAPYHLPAFWSWTS